MGRAVPSRASTRHAIHAGCASQFFAGGVPLHPCNYLATHIKLWQSFDLCYCHGVPPKTPYSDHRTSVERRPCDSFRLALERVIQIQANVIAEIETMSSAQMNDM